MSKSKLPTHCVYIVGWEDSARRYAAVGDGITSPSRLLLMVCSSAEEAELRMREILDRCERDIGPRIPGDAKRMPELCAGEFDPLDFVGSQNRDQYTGKRYANLCADLLSKATTRLGKLPRTIKGR